MKISIKNTRLMLGISSIYAIVMIALIVYTLQGYRQGIYMTLVRETLFVVPLVYMLQVLKLSEEKRSIIIAFTVFIYLDIIAAVLTPAVTGRTNVQMTLGAAILLLTIAIIVLIVQFFKIRNEELSVPYSIFGFAYIFYVFFSMICILLSNTFRYPIFVRIGVSSILLIPLAQLYVLSRIYKHLKKQEDLNLSINQLGITTEREKLGMDSIAKISQS
jgi:hypothetical protein